MIGFNGLQGQDWAVGFLRKVVSSGRVASAYLFTGPSGVGKKTAAMAFSAAVNCAGEGDRPCGRCRSCLAVAKGNHPDVTVWRRPEGKKIFPIDTVRELIGSLALKAYEGRWKVAVLDEADSMNQEAANALLLTLEEPPPRTVLILVAANPDQLPETILSRCQRVRFSPLSDELVVKMLASEGVSGPLPADLAAFLGEGSIAAAREYQSKEWVKLLDSGTDLLREILDGGGLAVTHEFVSVTKGRDDAEQRVVALEKFVRLAVRRRLGFSVPALPGASSQGVIESLEREMGWDSFTASLGCFQRAKDMLRGNVSPRLVVEGLILELQGVRSQLSHKGRIQRFGEGRGAPCSSGTTLYEKD